MIHQNLVNHYSFLVFQQVLWITDEALFLAHFVPVPSTYPSIGRPTNLLPHSLQRTCLETYLFCSDCEEVERYLNVSKVHGLLDILPYLLILPSLD